MSGNFKYRYKNSISCIVLRKKAAVEACEIRPSALLPLMVYADCFGLRGV